MSDGAKKILQAEVDSICEEEGFRSEIYKDHLGNDTIGHGLTWISEYESKMVVSHRFPALVNEIFEKHPILAERNIKLAMIVTHMAYQLGVTGVGEFRRMWAAIEDEDYEEAASEMLDSKWHDQTPARAERLAARMRACAT